LTAGAIHGARGPQSPRHRTQQFGPDGAASSYKSGDLFVEGSLHETSDPHDPRDPKHDALTRAGVIDAVKWIPSETFYQVRGGPLAQPFVMPDNFDRARRALAERFPEARAGIHQLLGDMGAWPRRWAGSRRAVAPQAIRAKSPRAIAKLVPAIGDWKLSLSQKLDGFRRQ
jgi:hypothetical protein